MAQSSGIGLGLVVIVGHYPALGFTMVGLVQGFKPKDVLNSFSTPEIEDISLQVGLFRIGVE